jgi:hypothetical protein
MKLLITINLLLGIWLLFAPFVLGFAATASGAAAGNGIVGVVLIVTSVFILQAPAVPPGISALQTLCGLWLVLAPFVRGFQQLTTATHDNVGVGVVAVLVALATSRLFLHPPRIAG